jgi:NAD(P)-dependent dehydrogenase (short-subunit alcohol dehydrogenase family)
MNNVFSPDCLKGSTYLVTGASSGIGRATAILIAACGGKVIAAGRDEARLAAVRSLLAGGAEHATTVQDLRGADSVADWVKGIVETHGALSGVFHAAGVELIRPVRMTRQAQIDEVFSSSLYAAFGLARGVSQKNAMIDGGSVVFMSSVAGSTGQVGMTAYSAAKAGIDGLVRSLSCELAPRAIRVNAIAAGAVETAMHARLTKGSGEDATNEYGRSHLLGFGAAEDIAHSVVFLLSAASRWITGSVLAVDGGYMVR